MRLFLGVVSDGVLVGRGGWPYAVVEATVGAGAAVGGPAGCADGLAAALVPTPGRGGAAWFEFLIRCARWPM